MATSSAPPAYGSVPEQQVRLLDDSSGSDVKSVGTNTLTHEQAKHLLVKFVDSKSCYSSTGVLSFFTVFSRFCSCAFVAAKNCTITGVSSAASCHVQLNSFLETRTVATVSVGSAFVCSRPCLNARVFCLQVHRPGFGRNGHCARSVFVCLFTVFFLVFIRLFIVLFSAEPVGYHGPPAQSFPSTGCCVFVCVCLSSCFSAVLLLF